jgi:hypothetical protein
MMAAKLALQIFAETDLRADGVLSAAGVHLDTLLTCNLPPHGLLLLPFYAAFSQDVRSPAEKESK